MRIVFMGTPEFAVPSLQGLYAGGHEVLAVFTQPDRPKGRGKQMAAPPIKEAALELNLPVFQPESVRTDEVYGQLLELEPDAIIVVAYGKILPKRLLDLPKWGCINVHASLLPAYRGAAPIHWAIVNGETETGITIMKMDEGLDTGDMLSKKVTPIHDNNTMGELHDRLKFEGAQLLLTTLEGLQAGNVTPVPQSEVGTSYASLIKKEHEQIDWNQSAQKIHDHIRGFNPFPGTYTNFRGERFKIWQSLVSAKTWNEVPGTIYLDGKEITVSTGDGTLTLIEVQPQSSRKMAASDWASGHKLQNGEQFEEIKG